MSREPFSLFHHGVFCFYCFSVTVMMYCISWEASSRAKHICVLTATKSRAKIWFQQNAFKLPRGLGRCQFEGCGYVIVASIFGLCFVMQYLVSFLVSQSS